MINPLTYWEQRAAYIAWYVFYNRGRGVLARFDDWHLARVAAVFWEIPETQSGGRVL